MSRLSESTSLVSWDGRREVSQEHARDLAPFCWRRKRDRAFTLEIRGGRESEQEPFICQRPCRFAPLLRWSLKQYSRFGFPVHLRLCYGLYKDRRFRRTPFSLSLRLRSDCGARHKAFE